MSYGVWIVKGWMAPRWAEKAGAIGIRIEGIEPGGRDFSHKSFNAAQMYSNFLNEEGYMITEVREFQ